MATRNRAPKRHVVIVGGGVMGCASAWQLARKGVDVTVLERSVPGAEASSAAAGILGAQAEMHDAGPMTTLALLARGRYPRWEKALRQVTGIDIGYRKSGLMRVGFDRKSVAALAKGVLWQRQQGLAVERLDARLAHTFEPELAPGVVGGVRFPEDARLDPRLLLPALHGAALAAGARFTSGAYVRRVVVEGGRAVGVSMDDGNDVRGSDVVIAAGSWTSLIDGVRLRAGAVRPARGQIVELSAPAPLLKHVVFGPRCYLVPRDDGRTLVGSTLEFVGYRREVTAQAVRDLLDAAIELVPNLGAASLTDSWSSFRPWTPDELPLIGSPGIEHLWLASGHYRNGILLAPITAEIVTALVLGQRPPMALDAFDPRRALDA